LGRALHWYWPGQLNGGRDWPAHPANDTVLQPGHALKSWPNTGSSGPVRPFVSLKMSLTTAPPFAWIASMHACGEVAVESHTPVAAAFVQHARSLNGRTDVDVALGGAAAAGGLHLSPRAELRWRPASTISFSGGYARVHQFAQSLRNAESVVGTIFPVDLYVGAGGSGVPVARSDQGILAVEYRPTAGLRVAAQAFARDFHNLALVAPRDADHFATSGFMVGSGTAQGISFEDLVVRILESAHVG